MRLVVAIIAGWVSVAAAAPRTDDVQVWQDATFYLAAWHHAFGDGTRIALSPGVPLGPPVAGGRAVAISPHGDAPVQLVQAIPDADVGVALTPSPPPSLAAGPRWEIFTRPEETRGPGLTVELGEHAVWLGHILPLVAPVTYRGNRALLPIVPGCARLVAELTMLVPRGTPLATTTGRAVATAAHDFAVAPAKSGQACTELALALERGAAPEGDGKLALCAPAGAVVPRPVRHVGGDTATVQVSGRGSAVSGVAGCLTQVIGSLAFRRPSGPVRVSFPLMFDAG